VLHGPLTADVPQDALVVEILVVAPRDDAFVGAGDLRLTEVAKVDDRHLTLGAAVGEGELA